ncbi:glycosyltransferase family protein [Actinacidiphila oryziradicis]|uniref:Spore protein YkvP/CgeB glycosyl transferase-like domain-containing protein n=1 Tax=Actinacidiphila oryziradicis TaxID=2571141 RepID=A0A4U0SNM7_9ACTN|nr:hypothetical protein [Actinacidiphila oryziradicis]TKA11620.1 hypothetical protein FCI23_09730 [Actinacidiphila oryziradicis]
MEFARAFARLAADGLLVHVPVAAQALLRETDRETALHIMRRTARKVAPDLVFVQSPHGFPWTAEVVGALLGDIGSPPVVYWEGDAWGGRKQLNASSAAWLSHADHVFSVAIGEQAALLGRYARAAVRYVPNVLPSHLMDADGESVPEPGQATLDVALIGSCYVRFGILERVDGAGERHRLTRRLCSLPNCRVALYGHGWRGPAAQGPVAYNRQPAALRNARISVGWDHYRRYTGYFSDRLPISMYAGRVHVSSRPPEAAWLPDRDSGLHLVDSPAEAVDRVRELLLGDPRELHAAGLRAHRWVRDRLTDLHALQYMLGGELSALPTPPKDPWLAVSELTPRLQAAV